MYWFELFFPPVMIASPLVLVLVIDGLKKHSANALVGKNIERRHRSQWKRTGPFTAALWLGTLGSLVFFFLLREWVPGIASFSWVLFFPLWFGCAMPLLMRKYPSMASPHPRNVSIRAASLKPRNRENPIKMWMWIPIALIWIGGLGVIGWHGWNHTLTGSAAIQWWIGLGCEVLIGAVLLGIAPWSVRMIVVEPEPMDPSGSPELEADYRALRNFRAWGLYGFCAVMMMTFSVFMTLMALGKTGPEMGLVGGIVGTVLGIAGGVFGSIAGWRRARLAQRVQELTEMNEPSR